jgi:RNA polymerase sigma factor (sigma-70 family)
MNKLNDELIKMTKDGSELNEIIVNILGAKIRYKDELISEICLSYLSNKEKVEKVIEAGYFKYYFINTVRNQVHSKTSPFYKNVILNNSKIIDEDIEIVDIIDDTIVDYKIEMELKWQRTLDLRSRTKMDYFESEMMRLYFDDGMTYRAIAEQYEINHTLVFKTIKDVLERIKKQIK